MCKFPRGGTFPWCPPASTAYAQWTMAQHHCHSHTLMDTADIVLLAHTVWLSAHTHVVCAYSDGLWASHSPSLMNMYRNEMRSGREEIWCHTPSSWSASASSWITSRLLCSLSQCMTTSGFDIIRRSRSFQKMIASSVLSSPSRYAQRYAEGSGTLAAYI